MATSKILVERSARIVSPKARASYPTLFVPRAFDSNSEAKYSITLMVPKGAEGDAFKAKVEELQGDALALLVKGKKLPANVERWGITDGDDSDDEAAHDHWLFKCSSKVRPAVIDQNKEPIVDSDVVYGGCYVRGNFCAKAYGSAAKAGVALELVAVQMVGDGEPFGGAGKARAQAMDEFDDASF